MVKEDSNTNNSSSSYFLSWAMCQILYVHPLTERLNTGNVIPTEPMEKLRFQCWPISHVAKLLSDGEKLYTFCYMLFNNYFLTSEWKGGQVCKAGHSGLEEHFYLSSLELYTNGQLLLPPCFLEVPGISYCLGQKLHSRKPS